jgi:hypothetical protein
MCLPTTKALDHARRGTISRERANPDAGEPQGEAVFKVAPPSVERTGEAPVAVSSAHHYGRLDLTWRKVPDGTWALHCVGREDAILHVVPDAVHPKMWRIRSLDGRLSDMANLTWARDGAIGVALGILNRPRPPRQDAGALLGSGTAGEEISGGSIWG